MRISLACLPACAPAYPQVHPDPLLRCPADPADREKMREEAMKTKYNAAAPPVAAYTRRVAVG